ncbi:putative FLP FmtA-like protein, betalactamase [Neohortaea acidophila]|uniref:Putative FLP FmtA-like protein, betalactamase n=1 Tax=Neohortaea acidophila TaxID=245834 RepID=A0A6A6Q112_9PEZI|nr:putative FLP FmtA-like protein, betalactamase [Neohortaea acidophila]KAF2485669.1 putative FLP FmtA-like protein, betalactamase [Neohortaea acidophila]
MLSLLWFATGIVPAFPVPTWPHGNKDIQSTLASIEERLKDLVANEKYGTTSFSVQLTSNTESLWTQFHTARKFNESRPGDRHVDGDSVYRIASISKLFTTLGLLYQHDAGNVSLDDPISKYIPKLSGDLPWDDITLRILASQLSGIPRETVQSDIINLVEDPTAFGLPPVSRDGLPTCDEYSGFERPCNWTDILDALSKFQPIFAPNQKSTYSNAAFELIGLVLEKVSGEKYEDYIQHAIFDPLGMKSSTFKTPSDKHAVIPSGETYWGINEGSQNPTGGIYSTASDMTKFVRYIMTHFNTLATGVNWLMPASPSGGIYNFYGMPFEIFRTDKLLEDSARPVTFVTKGGGLPAYSSKVIVMPEYGLGLTVLVGGEADLLDEIIEIVTVDLLRAVEKIIWKEVEEVYSGVYTAIDPSLNSTLVLSASPSTGLIINSWISNSTVVYSDSATKKDNPIMNILTGSTESDEDEDQEPPVRLQLSPTLLYKNESAQQGQIWMLTASYARDGKQRKVWDDDCTADVDSGGAYAGISITKGVFWLEDEVLELPGWRVKTKRTGSKGGKSPAFFKQDL